MYSIVDVKNSIKRNLTHDEEKKNIVHFQDSHSQFPSQEELTLELCSNVLEHEHECYHQEIVVEGLYQHHEERFVDNEMESC